MDKGNTLPALTSGGLDQYDLIHIGRAGMAGP
jgi:hypothetical protein